MSKKLVIPNSLNLIQSLVEKCDGFIIGVQNFSVNMPVNFSIEELKSILNLCKKNNKFLFVAINKNIHNSELDVLKSFLKQLSDLGIEGVMYYDVAIVNLKKELELNLNLIWFQEHLTTNYATCNFWNSFGVNGTYLSSDITLSEIIEIKKNTDMDIFVNVFGYLPMFVSHRHLVKNYLKTFDLGDTNNQIYKICKEGNKYSIIDSELGSCVYSSNILNGLDESLTFSKSHIDYLVLNSFNIGKNKFTEVVDIFTSVNNNNVKDYSDKINYLFNNIDKGFLYKETVYKVKNNE